MLDEGGEGFAVAAGGGFRRHLRQLTLSTCVAHYRLRVLAFHLLGDPTQMDEAFRALPGFSGRSALSTWLSRITYTTCMDHVPWKSRTRARHC